MLLLLLLLLSSLSCSCIRLTWLGLARDAAALLACVTRSNYLRAYLTSLLPLAIRAQLSVPYPATP